MVRNRRSRHGVLATLQGAAATFVAVAILAACSSTEIVAPGDLSATAGDESVSLSWSPVTGALGYRVLMNTSSGVSASTYTEARDTTNTEFRWSGLSNERSYWFAVLPIGDDGPGPLSDEIEVVPFAPPSGNQTSELSPDSETVGGAHGSAVATDGSFAAVGAPGQEVGGFASGAVFVYEKTNGGWSGPAVLSPPSPKGAEQFGTSVAMSGDTLVVGAPGWTDSFGNIEGRAFVYERSSGNSWTLADTVSAGLNGESGADFGQSVSISGDYAILGAPYEDSGTPNAGAAYVFVRGSTDWGSGTRLTRSGGTRTAGDAFGQSVAIDGDYLLAGIPGAAYSSFTNPGTAEVFRRTGSNSWSYSDELIASDAFTDEGTFVPDNERFGDAVAIDGKILVVGAPYDSEFTLRSGAVHVYFRTGEDTYSDGYKLLAPDASEQNWFGATVSVRDGWLAVGAERAAVPGYATAGAAYLFRDEGAGAFVIREKLAAPVPQASAAFGRAVAIGSAGLIAGEYARDGLSSNSGAAYAFE